MTLQQLGQILRCTYLRRTPYAGFQVNLGSRAATADGHEHRWPQTTYCCKVCGLEHRRIYECCVTDSRVSPSSQSGIQRRDFAWLPLTHYFGLEKGATRNLINLYTICQCNHPMCSTRY